MKKFITFILTMTMLNASIVINNPNDRFVMRKHCLEQYIGRMHFNEPLLENIPENTVSSAFLKTKSYLPINAFLAVINFEQNKPIKNELNDIFEKIKEYYSLEKTNQKNTLIDLVMFINRFEATLYDSEMPLHAFRIGQIMAK